MVVEEAGWLAVKVAWPTWAEVEDSMVAPVTARVLESVVAAATFKVEDRVVAPVTARVLESVAAAATFKVLPTKVHH